VGSFLGDFGRFVEKVVVKNVIKPVAKNISKAARSPEGIVTAIGTGGISLLAPKLTAPIQKVIGQTQFNPAIVGGILTKGTSLLSGGGSNLAPQGGVAPMALDLGGIFKQVGGIFGGNQNPVFNAISGLSNIASQFVPSSAAPVQVAVRPPAPTTPAVASAMRSVATVGRSFFQKYPNLATAIQNLRNRGANVSRSRLWSMLKRFGPEILISGGILTAAAVSELMVAGPGHRRMNPANVRALRRSVRRLKSFDRLSATVGRQLSRVSGKRRSARRCNVCRKNPCGC
jgi:hypothetical protein